MGVQDRTAASIGAGRCGLSYLVFTKGKLSRKCRLCRESKLVGHPHACATATIIFAAIVHGYNIIKKAMQLQDFAYLEQSIMVVKMVYHAVALPVPLVYMPTSSIASSFPALSRTSND